MRLTALPPPPPTPMTLMRAKLATKSSSLGLKIDMAVPLGSLAGHRGGARLSASGCSYAGRHARSTYSVDYDLQLLLLLVPTRDSNATRWSPHQSSRVGTNSRIQPRS